MPSGKQDVEKYLNRSPEEHWRDNELERKRRLREAGRRTLGENLEAGLLLIEDLASFTGAAVRASRK